MNCGLCKHPTPCVEGESLCKWHLSKMRSAKKQLSPAPKKSLKQAALDRIYNSEVAIFKKENPLCMAKLIGCTKVTTDVHHRSGRGVNLMNQDTWLPSCRRCHHQIEMNPHFAKALGLSKNRLT